MGCLTVAYISISLMTNVLNVFPCSYLSFLYHHWCGVYSDHLSVQILFVFSLSSKNPLYILDISSSSDMFAKYVLVFGLPFHFLNGVLKSKIFHFDLSVFSVMVQAFRPKKSLPNPRAQQTSMFSYRSFILTFIYSYIMDL